VVQSDSLIIVVGIDPGGCPVINERFGRLAGRPSQPRPAGWFAEQERKRREGRRRRKPEGQTTDANQ
jgi:hypothetical protein